MAACLTELSYGCHTSAVMRVMVSCWVVICGSNTAQRSTPLLQHSTAQALPHQPYADALLPLCAPPAHLVDRIKQLEAVGQRAMACTAASRHPTHLLWPQQRHAGQRFTRQQGSKDTGSLPAEVRRWISAAEMPSSPPANSLAVNGARCQEEHRGGKAENTAAQVRTHRIVDGRTQPFRCAWSSHFGSRAQNVSCCMQVWSMEHGRLW